MRSKKHPGNIPPGYSNTNDIITKNFWWFWHRQGLLLPAEAPIHRYSLRVDLALVALTRKLHSSAESTTTKSPQINCEKKNILKGIRLNIDDEFKKSRCFPEFWSCCFCCYFSDGEFVMVIAYLLEECHFHLLMCFYVFYLFLCNPYRIFLFLFVFIVMIVVFCFFLLSNFFTMNLCHALSTGQVDIFRIFTSISFTRPACVSPPHTLSYDEIGGIFEGSQFFQSWT